MSSQFRVEEFPASSEICAPVNTTNVKSGTNSISSTVHPVPAPFSTNALASSRIREGGSSQNEILFNRGKAINILLQIRLCPRFKLGLDYIIQTSCREGKVEY
jgi:hypothetical protein